MSIRKKCRTVVVLSLSAVAMVGCAGMGESKIQGPPLTGQEFRELVVGNTVSGPMGTAPYSFYYADDGSMGGVVGDDDDDSGTWLIKNDNVVCFTWNTFFDGTQECFQWYRDGKRYAMVSVEADRTRDIPVWRIEKGNPMNF